MSFPWSRPLSNCKWVESRLALRAGDDLRTADRRLVDRHLIGCPACRDRAASLTDALSSLRSVPSDEPASAAPSLWPEVRRQIQRSRHERRPLPLARLLTAAAVISAGLGALAFATGFLNFRGSAEENAAGLASNRPALPTGTLSPGDRTVGATPATLHDTQGRSAAERASDPQRSY